MKPRIAPPPAARFAVVVHPGTDAQRVGSWHASMQSAIEWARDYEDEDIPADVMKVSPDGTLTTEL